MASTPETKAKTKIKQAIADLAHMYSVRHNLRSNAAGGVGFNTGTADFTLTWAGYHVDIEVKAGHNGPTPKQCESLRGVVRGGGYGWVIWGDRPDEILWMMTHLDRIHRLKQADPLKLEPLPKDGP